MANRKTDNTVEQLEIPIDTRGCGHGPPAKGVQGKGKAVQCPVGILDGLQARVRDWVGI